MDKAFFAGECLLRDIVTAHGQGEPQTVKGASMATNKIWSRKRLRHRLVQRKPLSRVERLEPRRLLTADPWPYVDSIRLAGVPSPDATSLTYAVDFSEPVTGVDASDFSPVLTGVRTSLPPTVTGSNASYMVTIAGLAGSGTVGLDLVDDGSIRDASGNALTFRGAGAVLASRQDYAVGSGAYSAALADLDGDGILDMAVANGTSQTVSVRLGVGDGTFEPQATFPAGPNPLSIAAADLDGDGDQDLAMAEFGNALGVLLGDGTGGFGALATYPAGYRAYSVALGDVNEDGHPDAVVANFYGNVSVFLGTGTGTFGPQTQYYAGSTPISVGLGDVDRDGDLDVVGCNYNSSSMFVLTGNGTGAFGPPVFYDASTYSRSVSLGDVDGNGWLDVVVANVEGPTVSVFLNVGDGTFAPQISLFTPPYADQATTVDVNGDGHLDIAVAQGAEKIGVILGNGDGTFQPIRQFPAADSVAFVTAGDLDGDGRPDLVATNPFQNFVSVYLNKITGSFVGEVATITQPFPRVTAIALAGSPPPYATTLTYDVTFSEPVTGVDAGDFALALAGVTSAAPLVVAGNGAEYTVTVTGITGIGTLGLNLVDDGSIRSLAGNPLATAAGAPSFGAMQTVAAGPWPFGAALGDFDGDGTADIAVTDSTSDTVGVLLNTGGGAFLPEVAYATGANPWSVAASDLNGDGASDLAVSNVDAGTVSVLLGVGDGMFLPQRVFPAGATPYSVAIGDLDVDGKPDLVFANIDAASVTVLLGDGTGSFGVPTTYGVGWQPTSVALGDVDGDGIPDIAVTNFQSDTVGILFGNGDGTFGGQVTYATGARPYAVALGDLDADGDLDLAVTNSSSNSVGVFLNAGGGTFAPQATYATASSPNVVRVGDVTGDGIPDLSVTTPYADAVEVRPGSGDGTFLTGSTFAGGDFPVSLLQGDINGDGRIDLGFANYYGGSIGTLRNTATGDFTGELANVVVGNVYRVTSAADAGAGSLRQAILDANTHPGFDTITFALPGTARLLQPRSSLPVIKGPLAIDGATQPGIVLSGARVPGDGFVFASTAAGSFVSALAVRDWRGSGVRATGGAITVRGSRFIRNRTGVAISAAAGSVIGGVGSGNTFTSNFVGIAATGALSGAVVGWNVFQSDDTAIALNNASGATVTGNVISGSFVTRVGIYATGLLTGTLVQSNVVTGTCNYGVWLSSARGITVGLTASGKASAAPGANVITGNRLYGLAAFGNCTGSAVRRNMISGNRIDVWVAAAKGLDYVP